MIASKTLLGNYNPVVFSGILWEKIDGNVISDNAIPSTAWKRRKSFSKLPQKAQEKLDQSDPHHP